MFSIKKSIYTINTIVFLVGLLYLLIFLNSCFMSNKSSSILNTKDHNNETISKCKVEPHIHIEDFVYGNSIDNIFNRGLAVADEDWIYGARTYKLYAVKKDETKKYKICDDIVSSLNIINKTLYYINYSNMEGVGNLYKINKDGTNRTRINNEDSYYPVVIGDWIYYSTRSSMKPNYTFDSKICKIKTDGTNRSILIEGNGKDTYNMFYLYKGFIYYVNIIDSKLYRMDTQGRNKKKISDTLMSTDGYLSVSDDWIYYVTPESNTNINNQLYRMKLDGSYEELVIKDSISSINISDDWIYYVGWDNFDRKLYKIKIGDKQKSIILDKDVFNINIVGNSIFCMDSTYEYIFYKIDISGKKPVQEIRDLDT